MPFPPWWFYKRRVDKLRKRGLEPTTCDNLYKTGRLDLLREAERLTDEQIAYVNRGLAQLEAERRAEQP